VRWANKSVYIQVKKDGTGLPIFGCLSLREDEEKDVWLMWEPDMDDQAPVPPPLPSYPRTPLRTLTLNQYHASLPFTRHTRCCSSGPRAPRAYHTPSPATHLDRIMREPPWHTLGVARRANFPLERVGCT
jgi:hypothetical protein